MARHSNAVVVFAVLAGFGLGAVFGPTIQLALMRGQVESFLRCWVKAEGCRTDATGREKTFTTVAGKMN